jgi:hypothetical protein
VRFEFTFDDAGREVTIVLAGVPSAADFQRLADLLTADGRYRSGLLHLVDCSRLDAGGQSDADIEEQMAPLVERDWRYPPRAVAIYAPDGAMFRRAVLARAHMGGSIANRKVFADLAEARSWLAEQGA